MALFAFVMVSSLVVLGGYFVTSSTDFDSRGRADSDYIRMAVTGDGHWNITRGDDQVNNWDNYGNGLHYRDRHDLMINLLNDEVASNKGLDFVVFNGDLVHNDGREWENVKEQYDRLNVPYRVVHGNHDGDEHGKRGFSDWEDLWGTGYNYHEEYKGVGFIFLGTGVEYRAEHYRTKPWDFDYFKKWADYYTNRDMPVFLFTHVAFDHSQFGGDNYGAFSPVGQQFHNYIKNNPLVKATFFAHNHQHRGVRIIDGHPYYWSGHFGHQPPTRVNPPSYRVVEIDTHTHEFESYSVNALTREMGDESFTGDPCGSLGKAYPDIKTYSSSTTMWPSDDFCAKGTVTRVRLQDEPIVNFPSNAEDFFPDLGLRVDWECRVGINSFRCSAQRLASDSDPAPDPEPPLDPDPKPDDPDPKCSTNSDCNKYEVCLESAGVCLRGDINADGSIGPKDFVSFRQDFIMFKEQGWNSNLSRSDLSDEGSISMKDYGIFVQSYRRFNRI